MWGDDNSSDLAVGGGGVLSAEQKALIETTVLSTVLLLIILACVIGNIFVILAILWERELRGRPQYYLIFSLAVADLIVGVIVTPLSAWFTVTGQWNFGVALCDFWISVDVLVCTASILHLVAIALDRYWSITDISYVQNRTPKRILLMLVLIWLTSLLVSLAPFAGWKDDKFDDRVNIEHICLISQEISYQVFSTAAAFYIPLIAIIGVYWKIMRAAKKRFKRERDRRTVIRPPPDADEKKAPLIAKKNKKIPLPPAVVISDIDRSTTNGDSINGNMKAHRAESSSSTQSEEERTMTQCETLESHSAPPANGKSALVVAASKKKKKRPKESAETKRERKAWRTLAIITGTFVACWAPFFLVSLYRPICDCQIPEALEQITVWLGYLNSALNPIIYTVFSQDFRAAFKRVVRRLCLLK